MGFPAMGASGLPGNRLEAWRDGMTTSTLGVSDFAIDVANLSPTRKS
jgi:hypothetical protein